MAARYDPPPTTSGTCAAPGGGLQLVAALLQGVRARLQGLHVGVVLCIGRAPLRLRLRQRLVQLLRGVQ